VVTIVMQLGKFSQFIPQLKEVLHSKAFRRSCVLKMVDHDMTEKTRQRGPACHTGPFLP
jgi:hypothetical protein